MPSISFGDCSSATVALSSEVDTGWRKENANQNRKGFGQDLREPQAGDRANRFSAACGLDAQRTQIFLPVMLSAFSAASFWCRQKKAHRQR